MSQYQQQPAPKKPGRGKYFAIGCSALAALVVLIVVIAIAANSGSNNSTSTATTTPTTQVTQAAQPTATPTHALKWTVTHTFSGNGNKKTTIFSVPDDWKLLWKCDNTGQNYGVDGVLYVSVYGSDGTPVDITAVSGTCKADKVTADSTEEHQNGQVYLDINTSLPWSIQVQELK